MVEGTLKLIATVTLSQHSSITHSLTIQPHIFKVLTSKLYFLSKLFYGYALKRDYCLYQFTSFEQA